MSLDEAKERNMVADFEARIRKLERNFDVMKDAVEGVVTAHNKVVVGCQQLERKVDDHLKGAIDDKPVLIVPSARG